MKKMRVAQVPAPKQPFQIVERPVPEPGPGEVRVKVAACGICHSDMFTAEGLWPGIEYPRVPGHEVAGVVDAARARASRDGRPAIARGSAGTAGTAATARPAGAAPS